MGKKSYNQQVHHHPNIVGGGRTTKSFLPMFCRLSINDVVKPTKLVHLSSSPDPCSPKISCIGQIKIKKRSNNTTSITPSRISIAKSSSTNLNYTKLRKLFSGKNLISHPIDTATISSNKCISNRNQSSNGRRKEKLKHMISIEDPVAVRSVVVEELDPPLPVVKFHRRDHQTNVNLGKRRGIEVKTLQIQQFQLSTIHSSKIIDNRDLIPLQPPESSSSSSSS